MANDSLLFDKTINLSESALNGLAMRREIISQNVANVDTPEYRAMQVKFEDTLQSAIKSSYDISLKKTDDAHFEGGANETDILRTSLRPGGTLRADGNNVDIEQELSEMASTSFQCCR